MKTLKKNPFVSQHTCQYVRVTDILKFYEVLFCTYYKGLFCLEKTVIMIIFLRMHKTFPTLGNEKEQQQSKFYKNSLG